jgi:DNA-binding transcriptional regulator PaaX
MTLKERLARYLRNHHGWISKGELCDLAHEKTGVTGGHTGSRLRELAEEGILETSYRGRHAYYRIKETKPALQLASESVAYFNQL